MSDNLYQNIKDLELIYSTNLALISFWKSDLDMWYVRWSTSGKCKGPDITSQTLQGHANMVQVDNYLDKIIFADQASIMNDDLMPERWFNVEAI